MAQEILATGRRKTATARVRLFTDGDGSILINDKPFEEFFPQETVRRDVMLPLNLTETAKNVTVKARVNGGGITGQGGAIRHGISRALIKLDETFRGKLKAEGYLTRDPRMKERKKPGQPGARKRFQFSKR